jgi:hypothetical protein
MIDFLADESDGPARRSLSFRLSSKRGIRRLHCLVLGQAIARTWHMLESAGRDNWV